MSQSCLIAGAAARGLPVKIVASGAKSSGYSIISSPEINSLKALKGKRIAINSFGSSADFAIYTAWNDSLSTPFLSH
jgi:ABC-type nitrate/sulfonate/bicarbonate transport system substrate-binding protein